MINAEKLAEVIANIINSGAAMTIDEHEVIFPREDCDIHKAYHDAGKALIEYNSVLNDRLPSQFELKSMLSYDEATGLLTWKNREDVSDAWNTRHAGKPALNSVHKNGYKHGRINNKSCTAHRVIFKLLYGYEPRQVDHINHDRSDNRKENLRASRSTSNMKNVSFSCKNTSGHTGVRWRDNRKKWMANIGVNGRNIFLGEFANKVDAIEARRRGELKYGFSENHGKDGLVGDVRPTEPSVKDTISNLILCSESAFDIAMPFLEETLKQAAEYLKSIDSASKDVADDELDDLLDRLGKMNVNLIGSQFCLERKTLVDAIGAIRLLSTSKAETVADNELAERLRKILEHYESVNQSYEANHAVKAHGDGVEKLDRPVFQNEEDTLRQAITRLQAAPNPWCYDMEKAPKDGTQIELAISSERNEKPFVIISHNSGPSEYGEGIFVGFNVYEDTPYAWRHIPIAPPEEGKS